MAPEHKKKSPDDKLANIISQYEKRGSRALGVNGLLKLGFGRRRAQYIKANGNRRKEQALEAKKARQKDSRKVARRVKATQERLGRMTIEDAPSSDEVHGEAAGELEDKPNPPPATKKSAVKQSAT